MGYLHYPQHPGPLGGERAKGSGFREPPEPPSISVHPNDDQGNATGESGRCACSDLKQAGSIAPGAIGN